MNRAHCWTLTHRDGEQPPVPNLSYDEAALLAAIFYRQPGITHASPTHRIITCRGYPMADLTRH